jgi:four helix bundle protein
MPIRSHRDLIVWQKGMDLCVETYRIANLLPAYERFVLRQQMCRAGISVPSNIAEGHGRIARGDFGRHLGFSRGSLNELDTQFDLCRRIGYLDPKELVTAEMLHTEVGRLLWKLLESIGYRSWR